MSDTVNTAGVGHELFKYCPSCGAENSRYSAFCLACDADLSTVPPEPQRGRAPAAMLELACDPSVRFRIEDGQTVGRGSIADVILTGVPDIDAISRRHARFFNRDGVWYVQHVGGTNFIKVDSATYTGDEEVRLRDGSDIALSATAFLFRLEK